MIPVNGGNGRRVIGMARVSASLHCVVYPIIVLLGGGGPVGAGCFRDGLVCTVYLLVGVYCYYCYYI